MHRIDRQRIEGAPAPIVTRIATRFDDLDTQGHINNAAVVVLLQEARVGFNIAIGLPRVPRGLRWMVAGLHVEYARELHHPDPVEVATTILSIGRSSFVMGQVARQGGHGAVYAETAIVLTDDTGPAALPDDLRAAYAARCAGG